jgi:hypothetical protein
MLRAAGRVLGHPTRLLPSLLLLLLLLLLPLRRLLLPFLQVRCLLVWPPGAWFLRALAVLPRAA